jgi:enoyl-CoA hydratase
MGLIQVTHEGHTTIITITRPEARNAINGATAAALRDAWQAFEADEHARVGILTGGESVFCAGADLKEFNSLTPNTLDEYGALGFTRMFVSKPTIAAIAGYAVAGGLELACWCDLRIADPTAQFGCLERRFGVPLIDGLTQRLPRQIGLSRALDMILTGRLIDVHEAHAWGLVNEVTASGDHLRRALELAHTLAQFPQICMRNDRRAVYEGLGKDLEEGLRLEAEIGAGTIQSGESQSGAQAFTKGKGRKAQFD